MCLVAFHGKIGSGKNESSRQTRKLFEGKIQFEERAFAAPIKEIVSILFGTSVSDQYEDAIKNTHVKVAIEGTDEIYFDSRAVGRFMEERGHKTEEDNERIVRSIVLSVENSRTSEGYRTATYGRMQQEIGTRFREIYGENVWVDMAFFGWSEEKNWLFTDLRFPNEKRAIKERGGLCVRLIGDPKGIRAISNRNLQHISETALDADPVDSWDISIDNARDNVDSLRETLSTFYRSKGIL
jgi:hypothetical protein